MSFTQILANEEAHKLVDAIEELIATLEAGCGYKYIID
jgi:hypothetical protein